MGRSVKGSQREAMFLVLPWIVSFFCLPMTQAAFQTPSQDQAQQQMKQAPAEDSLRKRAEDLYVLLQLGRWDQAETYIAAASRENFRKQQKSPFLGFKVDSIQLNPDGKGATVKAQVEQVMPQSRTPITMSETTQWVLADNLWYLVVPDPADLSKQFQGLFKGSRDHAHTPGSPEELKFKGHRYIMGEIPSGQIRVARFPFTNVTDHVVTLSSVETGCPCLEAKAEKKEFKPGESGEIAITFNPAGYERDYLQTVVVKTDPGDFTTYLMVVGYVMPELRGRKPAAKSKPGL